MKMLSSQLIRDLITFGRDFNKVRSADINGKRLPFSNRFSRIVIFGGMSCLLTYNFNVISYNFIDYIKDIIAIFVGLFLTVLVFAYDRFDLKHPSTSKNEDEKDADKRSSSEQNMQTIRMYNYAKKFIYAIEFNIILGIILLGILVIPLDFPSFFNVDFSDYIFTEDISSVKAWKLFAKLALVFLVKAIALFLLCLIFYYTLYAVTHLEKYMSLKIKEDD